MAGKSVFYLSALGTRYKFGMAMVLPGQCGRGHPGTVAGSGTHRTRTDYGSVILRGDIVSVAGVSERLWNALLLCVGPLGVFARDRDYCTGRDTGDTHRRISADAGCSLWFRCHRATGSGPSDLAAIWDVHQYGNPLANDHCQKPRCLHGIQQSWTPA